MECLRSGIQKWKENDGTARDGKLGIGQSEMKSQGLGSQIWKVKDRAATNGKLGIR